MSLKREKLIVVTSYFPNSCEPSRALFIEHLMEHVRSLRNAVVVAPIPITPMFMSRRAKCLRRLPKHETFRGTEVYRPRYFAIPKMDLFSGLTYFLSIYRLLKHLLGHQPALVHVHCAYPDGVGVAFAARFLKYGYVVTAHGSDINVYAKRTLIRWQIAWAFRYAEAIIGVSSSLVSKIQQITTYPPTISHIPCAGYEPKMFHLRNKRDVRRNLNITTDAWLTLFVGNLFPIKGIDILIKAWAEMWEGEYITRGDRLVIVGVGPRERKLKMLVRDRGISESVCFLGALPNKEVALWMSAADTLCLPSYNEGTPNVVIEALASGLPVVASNVGGIPEILENNITGLLVEPGDPSSLAKALITSMHKKWNYHEFSSYVEHYTWETIASLNVDLLDRVAGVGQGYAHLA